ncbi:MAG TPA: 1,4-beta-xylanase, partial [Firmicutes bacterium]|nr:1,4-beta-xylanase [Bacillota bacterium]
MEYGFEEGDGQGWIPRGDGVQIAVVREAAYSGTYSLKTTNRTANWHGPSLDLTGVLQKEVVYEVTGYVKLMGTPAATTNIKITMEQKKFGASTSWTTV